MTVQKTPKMELRFEEIAPKKSLPSWFVEVLWLAFAVQAAKPVVMALPMMRATKTVYIVNLWITTSSKRILNTPYVALSLKTSGTMNGSASVVDG